jgi:hypothetical protein
MLALPAFGASMDAQREEGKKLALASSHDLE